jgi:hypothetical protein
LGRERGGRGREREIRQQLVLEGLKESLLDEAQEVRRSRRVWREEVMRSVEGEERTAWMSSAKQRTTQPSGKGREKIELNAKFQRRGERQEP